MSNAGISKKSNSIEISLSELFFYAFFSVLLFAKGIGLYDGQRGFQIALVIACGSIAGKALLTEYNGIKELIIYLIFVIMGAVIYYVSGDKGALIIALLILGLKGIDLKRLFKIGLVIWILSFGITFILSSLHIIESDFKVHDRLGMGRIIRWNLGQSHPNVLHISFLVLLFFIIECVGNRYKWSHLVLMECMNIFVFMYSLSTTGFLVSTLFLVFLAYWKLRKRINKFERILIQVILPLCIIISYAAPIVLKGKAFDIVNSLLNTRLELSKWFLLNQPIKLFGVKIANIVTATRTMDNSYLYCIITYGLLFTIVIYSLYFRMIHKKTEKADGLDLCIIVTCLIAGLTEPFLFNVSCKNISLLFLGKGKTNAYGNKFRLLQDREYFISIAKPKEILRSFFGFIKGIEKRTVFISIIIPIVASITFGMVIYRNAKMPERYILPRSAFEYSDDLPESYYLKSDKDVLLEGDEILGFESDEKEMVIYSGNIAVVERFRNTVSGIVYSFIIVFAIEYFVLFVLKRKKII